MSKRWLLHSILPASSLAWAASDTIYDSNSDATTAQSECHIRLRKPLLQPVHLHYPLNTLGGTAGLALAYRLAESGTLNIAVIEAGGSTAIENGNTSIVPAYSPNYGRSMPEAANTYPSVDRGLVTEEQEGLGGRRLAYGQGKMLGGSSQQNGMPYNRGAIGSQQVWADLVGDQSWTFENSLPFYAKVDYSAPNASVRAANATVPGVQSADATGGPLQLSYPNYAQIFSSFGDAAMLEAGLPEQQDLINGSLLGSQYAPLTIAQPEGERSSSESSYLRTALRSGRSNLKVYTHTLAKRVIFDGNNTAKAVRG